MKELIIVGTGGQAREVLQLVQDLRRAKLGEWSVRGFLDENEAQWGQLVCGLPVLGGLPWLRSRSETAVVIAIGHPLARRHVAHELSFFAAVQFPVLIHPRAYVGDRVTIGPGSVIFPGATVTTDIRLGSHVILNVNCSVSHDCILEDYATVAPGVNLAGGVRVGEGSELGINSAVIQGRSVGRWSILGAGAVATTDIPHNVTAVGVPARVIKERPVFHSETEA